MQKNVIFARINILSPGITMFVFVVIVLMTSSHTRPPQVMTPGVAAATMPGKDSCKVCHDKGYVTCWGCEGSGGRFVAMPDGKGSFTKQWADCSFCTGKKVLACTCCDKKKSK